MKSAIETLKITEEEKESCTDINNLAGLAVQLCQFRLTRKPTKLLSLVVSESLLIFLVLVFLIPLSLLVLQSMALLPHTPQAIQTLWLIFLGLIVGGALIFNLFLWRYQRRFKSLARLLLEIEKYNQTLASIAVLDDLENAQSYRKDSETGSNSQKRAEILKVLQITRQSLIDGLKIERILRQNQQMLTEGNELIANLETTCAALSTVEIRDRASEYSQIINDALSINLAIQREMNRLIR